VRGYLRLLTGRPFALLFAARTTSVLGSAFSPVALAFAVLALPGATATTLGLVLAAQAVPEVAFMLFGGVIADRFPRYRVMVSADLVAGTSVAVLAAVVLTGTARLPLIMALAACNGIAVAIFSPALTGIVPQVVAPDRLQGANGLLRLSTNGARILGLAAAGAVVVAVGPGWALAVDAATFLVSAALLAGLRLPAVRGASGGTILSDLRHGWREFVSRQWTWVIVLQFSLVNAAWSGVLVLGPVVAKRDYGGPAAWSILLAGDAIGAVAGVLLAIRLRPRRPLLVATLAVFPMGVPIALLGLRSPLWTIAVTAFAAGASLDVFSVLWDTALQQHIPPAALSRVSSYDWLGSLALGPLGLIAAGPAAAAFGLDWALWGCGLLVVLPTALALLSPSVRNLGEPQPARTG
jgi:hypothetical protein